MHIRHVAKDGSDLVLGDDWRPLHGAMSHGREGGERAFVGPWSPDSKGWFAAGYGAYRRPLGQSQVAERWSPATTHEGASEIPQTMSDEVERTAPRLASGRANGRRR